MAAAPRNVTLDITERQVLVDFFHDPNGLIWHARMLLQANPVPGVWLLLAPNMIQLVWTLTLIG